MSAIRVIYFFCSLFFAVESIKAMELSSLKEFTDEELAIFAKDNLNNL
jgi:hypothetical protein